MKKNKLDTGYHIKYVQVGKSQKGITSKTTYAGTKRARKMGMIDEYLQSFGKFWNSKEHQMGLRSRLTTQPSPKCELGHTDYGLSNLPEEKPKK